MANIAEYLRKILSARKGEEVRGSIHDSIKAMNDEIEEDLGSMIEDGNEVIEAMQEEIQSVETMKENGDLNMKPEDLTEAQWANLKTDLTNYYKRYESVYTTTQENETNIPINISQYNTLAILEVYIEGRMLNRNEYAINGTNSITLNIPLSEIGTKVHFIVYRSVCASNEDLNELKGPKGDSGAIVFDTIAEMIADEDLVAGDTCQTLGYYSANDGGAGLYKIVDDNSLVDDGGSVIDLDNELKAKLIFNDIINIRQFGAVGDGVTDDTTAIQNCIDNNPNKTIYFPNGIFGISSHIDTSANNTKSVSIKLDDFAVIKALSNYNDEKPMICLGGKNYNNYFLYDNFSNYGLDGGTIDCNGIANGISIQNAVQTYVKNIKINHCPLIGINVVNGVNNNSADALVSNCVIIGTNNTQAIGLNVAGADNLFENIRIFHCKYGVYVTGGGNHFNNVHCLATTNDLNENYNDMVAFYIKGNHNYFNFPYNDQYATGFYIDGIRRTMVNDYYCYYWADDFEGQHTAIECSARMTGRFNNIHCRFPSAGQNTILKVANKSLVDGFIKTLTIHNTDNLNNSNDLGYNPLFNKDTMLLDINKLTNQIANLTFNYNEITVSDDVINYNAIVSGIEIPASTNTVLFKLPEGFFNPNKNVNINAKIVNNANYQRIVCYISTSGSVIVNTPTAISGGQIQILGSALNTKLS